MHDVLPFIDEVDANHIKQILMQGCPSQINFEETLDMKASIIKKGNQVTFKTYPEIVTDNEQRR